MTKISVNLKIEKSVAILNQFHLVDKWIAFAQVKPSSVKSYTKGIKRLAEYCAAKNILNFSRESLLEYRLYLSKKYAPTTANLYLTAAKLFFSFLKVEGYINDNPAERVKGFKVVAGHKKDSLSADAVKKILGSFDTSTEKGLRDKAMFALMTTAGLRTIEIIRADVGDIIERDGKKFLLVQGKARDSKDEVVRIVDGVYKMIQDYLAERGNISDDTPLFASCANRNYGDRMTTTSISRIIKTALKNAGYNSRRLTAHSLRHTAATVSLKSGATLREVQQVLRHTSIVITQIYLHELDRANNTAECLAAAAFGI